MQNFLHLWNEAAITSLGFFWMALYLLVLMLVAIVIAALTMHYALAFAGLLPDFTAVVAAGEREYFKLNYQLVLNVILVAANVVLVWLWYKARHHHHHEHGDASLMDKVVSVLALVAVVWLSGGLVVALL